MRRAICGLTMAAVLAGCGSQTIDAGNLQPSGLAGAPILHSGAKRSHDGRASSLTWISPDAGKERQLLFVSDIAAGALDIFSLPKPRRGGPQFSASWLVPVIPASPSILRTLAKFGVIRFEPRL